MLITIVKSDPRAREKPCLRCGLSLRKMLDATHCPRCGLSVWLSLNDNQSLDWSNPHWLRRLYLGACIMAPAQLLAIVAFALAVVPVGSPSRRYPVAAILAGAYLIVYHLGLIVASTHEHRHPDRLSLHRAANRIITGVAAAFALALLAQGLVHLPGGWPMVQPPALPATLPTELDAAQLRVLGELREPHAAYGSVWVHAAEVVLLLSAASTFAYLRPLARRVPSSFIARICGYILLAPVLSFLKTFPITGYFVALYLFGFVEYLPAIYYPVSIVLLGWFAIAFRRAAKSATESWTNETRMPAPVPA